MKRIIFLFFTASVCICSLRAQVTAVPVIPVDPVEELKRLYTTLSTDVTTVKTDIVAIDSKVKTLENKANDNFLSGKVAKIETDLALSMETQKKALIEEILSTYQFVLTVKEALGITSSNIKNSRWMSEIVKLNNIQNKDMGYSMEEVIKKAVETHISKAIIDKNTVRGRVPTEAKDAAEKVNRFVHKLVNNPITQTLRSVPVVNTIVGFVSNLCFTQKGINEDDFSNFIDSLFEYIKFFDKLKDAQENFEKAINSIDMRAQALNSFLTNFVDERSKCLPNHKEHKDLLSQLNHVYNRSVIDTYISSVKNSSNAIEDLICLRPRTNIDQAKIMKEETEYLVKEYLEILRTYNKEVSTIIDECRNPLELNKVDSNEKKEKKKKALSDALNQFEGSLNFGSNLEGLKNAYGKISQK